VTPPTNFEEVLPQDWLHFNIANFSSFIELEALFSKTGEVTNIQVKRSLAEGKLGFEKYAIEALKKWKFQPATYQGEPVDFVMRIRCHFCLSDQESPRCKKGMPTASWEYPVKTP